MENELSVTQTEFSDEEITKTTNRKRTITKNKNYLDFVETYSDEDDVPDPPRFTTGARKLSSLKTLSQTMAETFSDGEDMPDLPRPTTAARKLSSMKITSQIIAADEGSTSLTTQLQDSTMRKQSSTLTQPNTPTRALSSTLMQSCTPTTKLCSCAHTGILQTLAKKVEEVSQQQKYIINLIMQQTTNNAMEIGTTESDLPLNNHNELIGFEEVLADETIMLTKCSTLQVVGGKDVADTTRRIMSRVVTNALALKLNWSGRNDKIGFSKFTNILKMITGAVRKNPFSRSATQQEIESVIKVWLRNAPDRDGGRSKRFKKNQIQNGRTENI